MRYWDASALLALCVDQGDAAVLRSLGESDPLQCTWWGSRTECLSAFSRLERERILDPAACDQARRLLEDLSAAWLEIPPTDLLRSSAERVIGVHGLKSLDAFQLAGALVWCGATTADAGFVTLDRRLAASARREGFSVLP